VKTSPSQETEEMCAVPSNSNSGAAPSSQKEHVSCSDSVALDTQRRSVSVKPVPCTPKPKVRTKLSGRSTGSEAVDGPESKARAEELSLPIHKSDANAKTSPSGQSVNSCALSPHSSVSTSMCLSASVYVCFCACTFLT